VGGVRTKAKRDAIEPDVIAALAQVGVTCEIISSPGAPDLACHQDGMGMMIKMLELKSDAGRLTRRQKAWRLPRYLVRNVTEALAVFGVRS
jgi:hypothetical protein